jgi:hypothetical protein
MAALSESWGPPTRGMTADQSLRRAEVRLDLGSLLGGARDGERLRYAPLGRAFTRDVQAVAEEYGYRVESVGLDGFMLVKDWTGGP